MKISFKLLLIVLFINGCATMVKPFATQKSIDELNAMSDAELIKEHYNHNYWDINQDYQDKIVDLFKKRYPKWKKEDIKTIKESKIILGMNEIQVQLAWGIPSKINRSAYAFGVHEQWVYEGSEFRHSYLYFEDGILKSWQIPEK